MTEDEGCLELDGNQNHLEYEGNDFMESVKTVDDRSMKTDYSEDFESGISETNAKDAAENGKELLESRSGSSTLLSQTSAKGMVSLAMEIGNSLCLLHKVFS